MFPLSLCLECRRSGMLYHSCLHADNGSPWDFIISAHNPLFPLRRYGTNLQGDSSIQAQKRMFNFFLSSHIWLFDFLSLILHISFTFVFVPFSYSARHIMNAQYQVSTDIIIITFYLLYFLLCFKQLFIVLLMPSCSYQLAEQAQQWQKQLRQIIKK